MYLPYVHTTFENFNNANNYIIFTIYYIVIVCMFYFAKNKINAVCDKTFKYRKCTKVSVFPRTTNNSDKHIGHGKKNNKILSESNNYYYYVFCVRWCDIADHSWCDCNSIVFTFIFRTYWIIIIVPPKRVKTGIPSIYSRDSFIPNTIITRRQVKNNVCLIRFA